MDATIANEALRLAMEWGADWLKPTQPRLKVLFPALGEDELNEYDAAARAAMSFANRYVYDRPECAYEQCAAAVRTRFAWSSDENLKRLYSQAVYYARK